MVLTRSSVRTLGVLLERLSLDENHCFCAVFNGLSCSNQAFDHVGERCFRIRPPECQCAGSPARKFIAVPANAVQHRRQRSGRESRLVDQPATSGMFQSKRVFALILIKRMRQRHQNGRPADDGKLADSGRAGAAHHKMGGSNLFRQIGEERRNLGTYRELLIDRANAVQILFAALLHDLDTGARRHRGNLREAQFRS